MRVAFRIIRDADLAEDCVQTVFVRLLLRSNNPPQLSEKYLVTAVRHQCFEELTRQKRIRRLKSVLEAEWPDHTQREEEQGSDPNLRLEELLKRLPPRCAAVVRMRAQGNSYDKIARQLRISAKTVDAQLQRARKTLRNADS